MGATPCQETQDDEKMRDSRNIVRSHYQFSGLSGLMREWLKHFVAGYLSQNMVSCENEMQSRSDLGLLDKMLLKEKGFVSSYWNEFI